MRAAVRFAMRFHEDRLSNWECLRSPNCLRRRRTFTALAIAIPFKESLDQLDSRCIQQASGGYASLLRQCGDAKSIVQGKQVHAQLVKCGFDADTFLGNLLVQMYGKCASLKDAQSAFDRIRQPNVFSWTMLLAAYAQNGDLQTARTILEEMPEPDLVSWTSLVVAYAKCGDLEDARNLFDRMPERNVVSWNAMLTAYAQNGHDREAFKMFRLMSLEGVKPNAFTYTGILDACVTVDDSAVIHASAVESGWSSDVVVGTAILHTLGKLGTPHDARRVFDNMPCQNVVSWNAMIAAYARNGYAEEALEVFCLMDLEGMQADEISFLSIINACDSLAIAQTIHDAINDLGMCLSMVLGTALVTVYAKWGNMQEASRIFDRMPQQDVVSHTAMITGYTQNGYCEKALQLFSKMDLEGLKPDEVTYTGVLDACARNAALEQGKIIHECVLDSRVPLDVVLGTAIVNMYGKCGSLQDARSMFESMPRGNWVTWNAMIAAYAQNEHSKEALQLFWFMGLEGIEASLSTFVSVLDACTSLEDLTQAKLIHATVASAGLERQLVADLVSVYGKYGRLQTARSIFEKFLQPDVVLWTTMITSYTQNENGDEALNIFRRMDLEGVKPDEVTFMSVLEVLPDVEMIHARIVERGFQSLWGGLINMYGKSGRLQDASRIFTAMAQRDVVSWNALIGAYVQNSDGKGALRILKMMDQEGVAPNEVTLLSILDACASIGAVAEGKAIHSRIVMNGFGLDMKLGNALVSMYGKCGNLGDAMAVFNNMILQDTISWNAIIACYAQNGRVDDALQLFWEMRLEGGQPNIITFTVVLSACSHAGLVDDAHHSFTCLHEVSVPSMEHYVCMIDVLGRSGQLNDAGELINGMPYEPDALVWMTLLGACGLHGDVGRSSNAAQHVSELEPGNPAPYVMMSNMYSTDDKKEAVGNHLNYNWV